MLFQLLKKDLVKRKGINLILFLFITLATVFLCSSVNNILIVSKAVTYYMDYANVADLNIITNTQSSYTQISEWLDSRMANDEINEYQYNEFLIASNKTIYFRQDDIEEPMNTYSTSIYLSKDDVHYNRVFDESGHAFSLQEGEIALSVSMMNRNQLNVGDVIVIHGTQDYSFTIKTAMKDAAFGSEMVGMSRMMISDDDFDRMYPDYTALGLYYLDVNSDTIATQFENQAFSGIVNTVDKDMYELIYSFDMIIAGLLIAIGVCLILIAMLVLRFTLIFTMEEQYQEIGILKAIGFRDYAIKKLFLIKYLAIVCVGSLVGFVSSIPVSYTMIQSVSANMIMENNDTNLGVNIICAILVIVLVLWFCYFCTHKLHKVSAITAIRCGQIGERFHRKRGLSLAKRSYMKVFTYLGINDILSDMKRFVVLMITFGISFILITVPLNTLNTMRSDEMVHKFSLDPDSAVYVSGIELDDGANFTSKGELQAGIDRVRQELTDIGYDATLVGEAIFFLKVNAIEGDTSKVVMSIQVLGDNQFLTYDDGAAPRLENEIAVSRAVMNENNWRINDYVEVLINQKPHVMLITGTYSDYMQLGYSIRLNTRVDCSQEILFDYWNVMVNMDSDKTQAQLADILSKELPAYTWMDSQQAIDNNLGGIQDRLAQMVLPMTLMLCAVIMLITLLMEKLFITREKGEVAMMKSIGFTHRSIRGWQMVRMICVALSSMLLEIPLSLLSNQVILKPLFAIMGADVAIQVDPLQAYLIYPGILLVGILVSTLIATNGIRRIDIREMNNLE